MPRSLWTGSLSFGLVNVPVQLVSAARDLDYHFRQLHEKDNIPIDQRRFCSQEDIEVDWSEVAHSYDLDGRQVVLSDAELNSVQPRKTRTIEIERFVDLGEVDPIYFDHPYFLLPAGDVEGTLRAYRLLVEVMRREERVALGRFVMRRKEYLAAVRVRDGALALTSMLFHDEVRDPMPIGAGGKKPGKSALRKAVGVIDGLSTDWDPERYRDCYRERLKAVIDRKREGATIRAPAPEKQPSPAPDLMAALEETLAKARSGVSAMRDLHEAAGGDQEPDGDGKLEELSRDELYERAQRQGIRGRSKMSKRELVAALRRR